MGRAQLMRLYNYFRSSASFRVRIALALKGLDYEYMAVHLANGEHHSTNYALLSSSALVPTLVTDDGQALGQSMAIIEYLEEIYPKVPLLPTAALDRARVRALAQTIACDTHPVNNLRVLQYLTHELNQSEESQSLCYSHWVRLGLEAFERELQKTPSSRYCFGDSPTLADCCLVPQIFNAQRFEVELSGLPRTMSAFDACMRLPAVQRAQPAACPDCPG